MRTVGIYGADMVSIGKSGQNSIEYSFMKEYLDTETRLFEVMACRSFCYPRDCLKILHL